MNDLADPATVRGWLDEVLDPEIPALSIGDLGIVREVRWELGGVASTLVVTLTPTYSGCPAMAAIEEDVLRSLETHGVTQARIERALSPAWTTDWMSARGRERLLMYGIVPPQRSAEAALALGPVASEIVRCPRCSSGDTEELSRFGSTACKALHRCRACGEPFDYFKPH